MTFPSVIAISPTSAAASKILALIEDEEGKYQTSLNDAYHEMKEKTFKGLRRTLPLTRQKLDWDKVQSLPVGAGMFTEFGSCSRFLGINWVQNCRQARVCLGTRRYAFLVPVIRYW